MPRVSVLCTNFNAGALVGGAIASVLAQTFTDWDLLVMDDGSSDPRTLQALEDWDGVDSRVRIALMRPTPTPAQRAASVRYATLINWGAAHTTGEYITYLSGDDYYLPDRLERMVAKLDASGRHVVYGAQQMIGDTVGIRETDGILTDAYHRVDLNSVMHTRSSFVEVGGWQDMPATPELWRCADGHFWRRLTGAGYVFVPVPGGPTDVKRYRGDSVDERVKAGLTAW